MGVYFDGDYWEAKDLLKRVVGRNRVFSPPLPPRSWAKEKGRKVNYSEFLLDGGGWERRERLLNESEIKTFLEVSLRASACPMPVNIDVWDGFICPFNCKYCFANYFRASLYSSFFDNYRTLGLRHSDPVELIKAIDDLMNRWRGRREDVEKANDIQRAIALEVPLRFGIRFEDFLPAERSKGVSLEVLRYLASISYPLMINTKSDLVASDDYLKALGDNPAGAAVHITLIYNDCQFLKRLEPGAPDYSRRLVALRRLAEAGIRPVLRIEPFMVFLNDDKERLEQFREDVWEAGVRHITFDSYSWSATGNIPAVFAASGWDWERMFTVSSDSQWLSSFMLGLIMRWWRERGFSCSTFDYGNVWENDDDICCEVGSYFSERGFGFNWGSGVTAIRFIRSMRGRPVSWGDFKNWVKGRGGFLSDSLKLKVHQHWNCDGDTSYSIEWGAGIEPCGWDENGYLWKAVEEDYRERLFASLVGLI